MFGPTVGVLQYGMCLPDTGAVCRIDGVAPDNGGGVIRRYPILHLERLEAAHPIDNLFGRQVLGTKDNLIEAIQGQQILNLRHISYRIAVFGHIPVGRYDSCELALGLHTPHKIQHAGTLFRVTHNGNAAAAVGVETIALDMQFLYEIAHQIHHNDRPHRAEEHHGTREAQRLGQKGVHQQDGNRAEGNPFVDIRESDGLPVSIAEGYRRQPHYYI